MKALILTTSILLVSSIGWSFNLGQREQVRPFQGAGGPCYACTTPIESAAEGLRSVRNTITAQSSVSEILNTNEVMNFAEKCEGFVDEEGLGKWGQTIVDELHKNRYEALYAGTNDLKAICPGFTNLNDNSKELVWVMIINAMVHLESSCDKTETARGPNGGLIGLLQLHLNRENAYANGCSRGDGKTPNGTFRCGLAMLNKQLSNDEALFSRKSYWDVLRPQARSQKFRKVQAAVKKLSVCK